MNDSTPIIIGIGDVREALTDPLLNDLTQAATPTQLAAMASKRALNDAGVSAQHIDVLVMIRNTEDSIPTSSYPFGRSNNPPASVAKQLNATPDKLIHSRAGGDISQRLLNEWMEKLADGDASVVLLTGAEATATFKAALKTQQTLDWHEHINMAFEDCDPDIGSMVGPEELRHGLIFPTTQYAVIENAHRAQNGLSYAEHAEQVGHLFSPFSKVAANNDYAMNPHAYSPDDIANVGENNPYVDFPYTHHMVAKDGVNLGAAIVLSTVSKARELGVPEQKWVYLHGYAHSVDYPLLQRPDLASSYALKATLRQTLQNANMRGEDLSVMDVYSCFPVVVNLAKDALGLQDSDQILTQTGGLPYFGGPGNNYTMHGINAVVRALRNDTTAYGLATGNGGMAQKHAAGIYSCQPGWQRYDSSELQNKVDQQTKVLIDTQANGDATIESYTVSFKKGQAVHAVIVGRTKNENARFLANPEAGDRKTVQQLLNTDCIGKAVQVTASVKNNTFIFQ